MSSDVFFRSAAAVLFSLQILLLQLPFSYSIPGLIIRSYRTFNNSDADNNYDDYGSNSNNKENCPMLYKPENGDWEGSCEDATPEQSCTFQCNDGFQLLGKSELTCSETLTWDEEEPICIRREESCSELIKPENGEWEGSCEHATQGESCIFHCLDGFVLEGTEELFCTENVQWSAVTPKCRQNKKDSKYCRKPKVLDNSYYGGFCNGWTKEGEWCKVICKDGYKQIGDPMIYCKKNVTAGNLDWSYNKTFIPKCIKGKFEFCRRLQRPENVQWDDGCDFAKRGYECFFLCNKGYLLEGKAKLTCSESLEWDGSPPKCVKEEICPKIEKPENAVLKGDCENAKRGHSCKVSCNEGYKLDGNGVLRCISNLTWSSIAPKCVKHEYCPEIKKPENGNVNEKCTNTTAGHYCRITCNDGYMLEGDELFCSYTLEWEGVKPRCVEEEKKFCPDLQKPDNLISDGFCIKAQPGNVCKFICKGNFMIDGSNTLTCGKNFQWDYAVPKCTEYCEDYPVQHDYRHDCRKAKKGATCKITCNDGLKIVGNDTMTCTKNHQTGIVEWLFGEPAPHCIPDVDSEHCEYPLPMDGFTPSCIFNGKAKEGDKCKLTCNAGQISGDSMITCGKDIATGILGWMYGKDKPKCIQEKKEYCPRIDIPNTVLYNCSFVQTSKPGASCRFFCNESLKLEGANIIFCTETFEWSDAVPQCKGMQKLEKPANKKWDGPSSYTN